MSELPLVPIFSAAHVSKWNALPEDTLTRATPSRAKLELERTTVCDHSNGTDHDTDTPSESSKPGGSIFTMREREITVRVAASGVCSAVATGSLESTRACCSTKSRVANMAVKTHTWITLWFVLTAPVVLWDATYCFMRPRSMVGGDLHWIWEPYGIYQDIDYVYGLKALKENNGFTSAQALLNLVETSLNLAYIYLAHVSSWSGAPLIGFAAATMTLSKTALYWAQEYYCGGCAVGHNTWDNLLLFWAFPNGIWLVFPSMIVWRLGGDLIGSLNVASRSARKAASGKTQ